MHKNKSLKFILIIFFFLLNLNSALSYESNILPNSLCDKIYDKLNLGKKDLDEKIEIFVRYDIESVKINELDNTFEIFLDKQYSYIDENLLDILKTNFSEEPLIKDLIEKTSGTYCMFDYDKGISEKKFIDFKRYYTDAIFTKKGVGSYIRVYPSGGIRYYIRDEYNQILENKFNFQKFPFDNHTIVLAEHTNIKNLVEFIRSKNTGEKFKKMNETKDYNVIIPGWSITGLNQYDYFTPEDWGDPEMEFSAGSAQVFIYIERNSFSYILKFAFPIIFIVLISWGVFWIDPKDIKTRAELSIIALLSLIAFNFVISDKLPDLEYLTLLDSLVLTSYLFAGAATIISILVNQYVRKKKNKIVTMIDHQARLWGPVVYILANIVFGYSVITVPI